MVLMGNVRFGNGLGRGVNVKAIEKNINCPMKKVEKDFLPGGGNVGRMLGRRKVGDRAVLTHHVIGEALHVITQEIRPFRRVPGNCCRSNHRALT